MVNSREHFLAGIVLDLFMVAVMFFGIPVPLVGWVFELEPFSIILNELLLPHGYDQTLLIIILKNVYSLGATLICIWYVAKYLCVAIIVPLVMGVAGKSYYAALTWIYNKMLISENTYLKYFIHYRVFVVIAEKFISRLTLVLVIYSQVVLTGVGWMAVNGFYTFPPLMVAFAICMFVCGLPITIFLLHQTTYCRLLSVKVGDEKRNLFHTSKRNGPGYYMMLKWKAQQPFSLRCGDMFLLTKDAIINYVYVLNTNLTNAILLIPT